MQFKSFFLRLEVCHNWLPIEAFHLIDQLVRILFKGILLILVGTRAWLFVKVLFKFQFAIKPKVF
jgi:hypothetical protein